MLKCTATVFLLLASSALAQEDRLGFVFQMVRHGARAPLFPQPPAKFQVQGGCLTSEGMRQRMLLGSFNRERYIEKYNLLDETYNPNQIFAQATDVHRVLQSTYSEFMGLYPPTSSTGEVFSERDLEGLKSGKGLPPLRVRNKDSRIKEA